MNTNNFEIGDEVICVNVKPLANRRGSEPSSVLKLGAVYLVKGTMRCQTCGRAYVDVGITTHDGEFMCLCNGHATTAPIWWFFPCRFVKKQNLTVKEVIAEKEAAKMVKELVESGMV